MNFRRLPFQFNVTDPVEKRSELMRKFGTSDDNMLVTAPCDSFGTASDSVSSPRFQHRLPEYFSDGQSMKSANGADSVDSNKKQPRVRVIPIQVEGASDSYPSRQRTKSGDTFYSPQRHVGDDGFRHRSNSGSNVPVTVPSPSGEKLQPEAGSPRQTASRVYNIPVAIEGRNDVSSTKPKSQSCVNIPVQKDVINSKVVQKPNGPCMSKVKQPVVKKEQVKPETVDPKQVSLQQVEAVLKELQNYKEAVSKFTGSQSDKEYCYLDEMLTRCMLKLDNVETYGNEDVRKARKAAVKEVQDCINDLEAKVQANVESSDIENVQNGASEAKEEEMLNVADVETAGIGSVSDQKEALQEESSSGKEVEMDMDLAKDVEQQESKGESDTVESSNDMNTNAVNVGTQGQELENMATDKVCELLSDSNDSKSKEETDNKDIQSLEVDSAEMPDVMETETTKDVLEEQVPVLCETKNELVPESGNSGSDVESKSDSLNIESVQPETVSESGDSNTVAKPVPCTESGVSLDIEDNEMLCKSDVKPDVQAVEEMDTC